MKNKVNWLNDRQKVGEKEKIVSPIYQEKGLLFFWLNKLSQPKGAMKKQIN